MRSVIVHLLLASFVIISFNSCLTAKKYDAYVSSYYNDEVPTVAVKKKANNVQVTSEISSITDKISSTVYTTKVLPLLVYWHVDERHVTELNTQLPVANFARTFTAASTKSLDKILNGRQLNLMIKQVPSGFSMEYKGNVLVVVFYPVSWSKVYMHPEVKDLVVSYSFHESDSTIKTSTITVKNKMHDQNLRLFQSWKSATTEYLTAYDEEVADMTREFVNKLIEELNETSSR